MESRRIRIEDTIITQDMVDRIDPEDYIYYYLPPRVKPWRKLYKYLPDEDTKVMARGTKAWQRLIFSNGDDYYEYEEQMYSKALEYIGEHNIGMKARNLKNLNRSYIFVFIRW